MGTPQIIMIILLTFSLTVGITRHGKMVEINFWFRAIDVAILVWILKAGGFF